MPGNQPPPTDAADQLAAAAAVAAQALSIHNTPPWYWRIQAGTADLYLDTKPDSCTPRTATAGWRH